MSRYKNLEQPLSDEEKAHRKALKNAGIVLLIFISMMLATAFVTAVCGIGWGTFTFFGLFVGSLIAAAVYAYTVEEFF